MNRGSFFKTLFGGIAVAVLGPNVLKALPATPVVTSTYDPVLPALLARLRKTTTQLSAHDICSVLPMTRPAGLFFTMDYSYNPLYKS